MQNRIKELRTEREWSLEKLAEKCGASFSQIQKLEKGDRRLSTVWMERLAKAFGVSPLEIISSGVVGGKFMVPVVGIVGAGSEVFPVDDHAMGDGIYEVECPTKIDPLKGVALEVRGDSMEPMISEGFLLFYEERLPGVPAEHLNRICAVWLEDGRCMVKKIRKGSSAGRYNLESLNSKHPAIEGVLVQGSAFIKIMEQR